MHTNKIAEQPLFIRAELLYGDESLITPLETPRTRAIQLGDSQIYSAEWDYWLDFDIEMRNIPRAARITFTLVAEHDVEGDSTELFCMNHLLFSFKHELQAGEICLGMWKYVDDPKVIASLANNPKGAKLDIELEQYPLPVVFPSQCSSTDRTAYGEVDIVEEAKIQVENLLFHPLQQLKKFSAEEKAIIWEQRYFCQLEYPQSLSKVLLSVPLHYQSVHEMHSLLEEWPLELDPMGCLELLTFRFADANARKFAVKHLKCVDDATVEGILLPLVQALKYECHLDSPLARFLLKRGRTFPLLRNSFH